VPTYEIASRCKGEGNNHRIIKSENSGTFYHKETPQDSVATVEQVMQAHPEISEWAMLAGWAPFTEHTLKWGPGTIKLVAIVSRTQGSLALVGLYLAVIGWVVHRH
jgi:hypothetical protein